MVWAAAGTPNAVFRVPPGTLRILANATVAPFADESESQRSYSAGDGRAPGGGRAPASSGA